MNHHLSIQNPTTLSYSTMDNNNRTNRHNSPLSVKPPPKIALLFLTNTNHHHPILWKRFLDASPPNRYTIYAHPSCAFIALRQSSRATAKHPRAGSPFRQTSLPTQCHPTVVLPVRSYTVIRSLTMPVNRPQWAEQLTRDTWGALVKKTCEECHWKEGWIGTLFRRGWILFCATNPTRITATSGFRGMVLRIE